MTIKFPAFIITHGILVKLLSCATVKAWCSLRHRGHRQPQHRAQHKTAYHDFKCERAHCHPVCRPPSRNPWVTVFCTRASQSHYSVFQPTHSIPTMGNTGNWLIAKRYLKVVACGLPYKLFNKERKARDPTSNTVGARQRLDTRWIAEPWGTMNLNPPLFP